jgi:hypothetical protein
MSKISPGKTRYKSAPRIEVRQLVQQQLELLGFESSLAGILVRLDTRCCCRQQLATIAPGAGPHLAGLRFAACGAFRGWPPKAAHSFITEIVEQFDRTINRSFFAKQLRRLHGKARGAHLPHPGKA